MSHDATVYLDHEMAEADLHPMAGGWAAVLSSRCPGKETANEDAAALVPVDADSGVLVVADGLGGVRAGEQASKIAIQSVVTALEHVGGDDNIRTVLLNGIESANRAICEHELGAATTLAAVEVRDGTVRPYHVGDSAILVVGQRGKIKLQTISHSPVGYAVEAGIITEAASMGHEDRHVVSNVIGTPDMRIEIGSAIRLAPRDTVLLASDGLMDNLHIEEIVELVRKGPIDELARGLADLARQRMVGPQEGTRPSKPDDLTFVAFRLQPQSKVSAGKTRDPA